MGQVQDSLEKTAMKLLLLASLATLGLSAPQNSFFVLTRGTGARESTSYIDYSTGLRSSSSKVASAQVPPKLTLRASLMATMLLRPTLLLRLLTRLLPGRVPRSHLEVRVKLPRPPS